MKINNVVLVAAIAWISHSSMAGGRTPKMEPVNQLTIVANITAKADKVELVKAELLKLIDITRSEEGCINYDLHQDNANPAQFMFFENWVSRELWQAHMGNQHLKDYMAATEGAVDDFTLFEMAEVDQDMKAVKGKTGGLTIVANITAKADQVDLVEAELRKLIEITRAENGCVNYDLHQDNENPAHFLFYENWESRELWQAHMGNQHLKDYMAATEGAVAEFTLNEMKYTD